MCYLVRHQQPEAKLNPAETPPKIGSVRPRWIGAAAAMLIGGLAVAAALVSQPSAPPSVKSQDLAATAPLNSSSVRLSSFESASRQSSQVVLPTALAPDDDVPAASDVAKAGLGHCEHGL
jgi:hypothetical protein